MEILTTQITVLYFHPVLSTTEETKVVTYNIGDCSKSIATAED